MQRYLSCSLIRAHEFLSDKCRHFYFCSTFSVEVNFKAANKELAAFKSL